MAVEHNPIPPLDPSKLTSEQIRSALTATQWKTIAVFFFGAASAIFGVGYHWGQSNAESASAQKIVDLTVRASQYQQEVALAKDEISRLSKSSEQLKQANSTANKVIDSLQQELSVSTGRRVGQSNCDFIHSQIKAAQEEIRALRSGDVFSTGDASKEEIESRVGELEARIAGYQKQLGSCGIVQTGALPTVQ